MSPVASTRDGEYAQFSFLLDDGVTRRENSSDLNLLLDAGDALRALVSDIDLGGASDVVPFLQDALVTIPVHVILLSPRAGGTFRPYAAIYRLHVV